MIGPSKILTVSYGTFSCTLEGFDEPFNTMKAIAEYFRDLAADDRYFGAEPPTPDAAMLHKIAEREIQRRVEAKIGDNGVHLRARETTLAELAAPETVPEPSALPTLTAMPEGVAARLAKIRASVTQGDAEPAPVAVAFAEPEYTEDQHAEELVEDIADFAMSDDASTAPVHAPVAEDVAELHAAEPASADDDMLADLAALETPMAAHDLHQVADDDGFDMADLDLGMEEPETAEAPVEPAQDDDLAARLGALIDPDEIAENLAAEEPAPVWDAEVEQDVLAELVADEAQPEAAADDATPQAEAAIKEIFAEEIAAVEFEAVEFEAIEIETVEVEAVDAAPEFAAEPEVAAEEPAPELSEKIQRARARVIRLRRGTDVTPALVLREPVAAPRLTTEAEAQLARELADLEAAETTASNADDDSELRRQLAMIEEEANPVEVEPVEPVAEPAQDSPAHAAIAEDVQDDAVSRLIEQTQSEMAVPENRRRLSAISHLKAAVAATVAERFGTKAAPPEADAIRAEEPYRDDLARVVSPRRPEGSSSAPTRPAPLVLVSEQRIDRPVATPPATVTPVRPRRVSSAALAPRLVEEFDEEDDDEDENIFADAKGFAEFADRLRAHSLPDLLEAAAAYAATVEGRPSFSRPQLIRQVSLAAGDTDVSREEGLRSFGTLLRDGRIVKLRRGQFALTDRSRFLAEAKKITG
jgi:hypothetical protein